MDDLLLWAVEYDSEIARAVDTIEHAQSSGSPRDWQRAEKAVGILAAFTGAARSKALVLSGSAVLARKYEAKANRLLKEAMLKTPVLRCK